MPLSEAKKRANKRWNDENMKERYDRIQLVIPKGEKKAIQAAAAVRNESVNAYIYHAVKERIERDMVCGGDSCRISVPEENTSLR